MMGNQPMREYSVVSDVRSVGKISTSWKQISTLKAKQEPKISEIFPVSQFWSVTLAQVFPIDLPKLLED